MIDSIPEIRPFARPAGHSCSVSTGVHECLTFGTGNLDENGFWAIPCPECARAARAAVPRLRPLLAAHGGAVEGDGVLMMKTLTRYVVTANGNWVLTDGVPFLFQHRADAEASLQPGERVRKVTVVPAQQPRKQQKQPEAK